MSKTYIPVSLQRAIRAEAGHRCGYCRSSEKITGMRLQFEHLVSLAAGGATVRKNLWLACESCNKAKGGRTHANDPVTGRRVRLFNPRTQSWARHFAWSEDGTTIIGRTACGRATVEALDMNNAVVVEARRRWGLAGWHPPKD